MKLNLVGILSTKHGWYVFQNQRTNGKSQRMLETEIKSDCELSLCLGKQTIIEILLLWFFFDMMKDWVQQRMNKQTEQQQQQKKWSNGHSVTRGAAI